MHYMTSLATPAAWAQWTWTFVAAVWLWLLCHVQCHRLEHAFLCLASLVHLKCGLADSQIECVSFCFSLSLCACIVCRVCVHVCVCASVHMGAVCACVCMCVCVIHAFPPSPTCTCLCSLHVYVVFSYPPPLVFRHSFHILFICKRHCLLPYVMTNLEHYLFLCHVIAAH